MQWFRMYAEFATDPKVQSMDEAMQRRFVMLLCLNSAEELPKLNDDELAFALRISLDDLARTKDLFLKKGLITEAGVITKWDKRQFVSDSSVDRVQRYREKRRARGLPSNGYTKHADTVTKRDGHCCVYCGSTANLCIDHVLPVGLGGDDSVENLATACKACNSGKGGRTPDQAGYSWLNSAAKKRWEGWMSRRVTVTVTPSESDSETDTEKNKKTPSESRVAQRRDDTALTVFAHWQLEWKHPSTKLDQKRRRRIESRLKDFSADQLRDAISGFKNSPWHTGTDPKGQGTVYDSIDTLLRDNAQVETGLRLFAHPPRPPPKAETAHDRMQRMLNGTDDSRVIEHDPEFPALPGH